MTNNSWLLTAGLACAGMHGFAQERPNIIVFLVDDMGLMDTSVPFIVDENGQPQSFAILARRSYSDK